MSTDTNIPLDNGQTWHNVPSISGDNSKPDFRLQHTAMDIAGNVTEAKISVWRL